MKRLDVSSRRLTWRERLTGVVRVWNSDLLALSECSAVELVAMAGELAQDCEFFAVDPDAGFPGITEGPFGDHYRTLRRLVDIVARSEDVGPERALTWRQRLTGRVSE